MNAPDTAQSLVQCPTCNARSESGTAFCQQCGEQLQPREPRGQRESTPASLPGSESLGNLAQAQHGKHIRSARVTIMVVSLLTIVGAVAGWTMMNSQIASIERDPTMVLDYDAIRGARVMIGAVFGIGVFFFGLFFWAKKNPFAATLTALITYVTVTFANAAMDPTTLSKGLLFKIIIISLLIRGVKAGMAHRRLLEEDGAQ